MGHGGISILFLFLFFFFRYRILCAVRFPIRNSAPTKSSSRARATGEIRYYLAPFVSPQRSDNESIPCALTFAAPHPVTFTITPLASSFTGSFTGCTLSLNVISPSIWNEISRACESYRCCYCQLAQVVNEQKQRDRCEGEREKGERDRVRRYLEKGDIVIDRQEIVGGVSNDLFNWIIDAPVFVVASRVESVNARRRTATECTRYENITIISVYIIHEPRYDNIDGTFMRGMLHLPHLQWQMIA